MELKKDIIRRTKAILLSYETGGREAAYKLWEELEVMLKGKREFLTPEFFDLVTQLEFFVEEHPGSELGDLRHALHEAEVAINK